MFFVRILIPRSRIYTIEGCPERWFVDKAHKNAGVVKRASTEPSCDILWRKVLRRRRIRVAEFLRRLRL